MILTTDVAYSGSAAVAAGVLHRDWETEAVERTIIRRIQAIAPYEPGSFYKRELPCLTRLLEAVGQPPDAVVIDGYVTLGADRSPGLGWHLHDSLGRVVPVVGVAKSEFAGTPAVCRVYRGVSRQPLYVTAIGIPLSRAKACIAAMHGRNRIPTLLKLADRACRDHLLSGPGGPADGY